MKKRFFLTVLLISILFPFLVSAQEAERINHESNSRLQANPQTSPRSGNIVIFVAHPFLKESTANAALLKEAYSLPNVRVVDLYLHPKKEFNIDEHTLIMSEAVAVVLQFPFHFASAPSQMKKWIDDVFYTFSKKEIIKGKPLMVVTTTGSEESAYRSGGRNMFTIDELLRPYQLMATYSGMVWKTPFVVYGMSTADAEKNLADACKSYKEVLLSLLGTQRPSLIKPAKEPIPKLGAPKDKMTPPAKRANTR